MASKANTAETERFKEDCWKRAYCQDTLPDNAPWRIRNEDGDTLAHVYAKYGTLPASFKEWKLVSERTGKTVAEVALKHDTLPPDFDRYDLFPILYPNTKLTDVKHILIAFKNRMDFLTREHQSEVTDDEVEMHHRLASLAEGMEENLQVKYENRPKPHHHELEEWLAHREKVKLTDCVEKITGDIQTHQSSTAPVDEEFKRWLAKLLFVTIPDTLRQMEKVFVQLQAK